MLQQFVDIRFQRKTLEMIKLANSIIDELAQGGYTLTLRQLYYQLVARDVIRNKQSEYKRLGQILSDARMGGLVDWEAIEDRTRSLRGINHRETPADIIADAASAFRLDKWRNQSHRVEVWVEKDALVGVLQKACEPLDVDYFSCRGNTSSSALYNAHERFVRYFEAGQQAVIVHLGDHDPTGIDMTRDIIDRLTIMVTETTGHEVTVERIALNMDQVRQYNPPPNPAKESDSRYKAYVKRFGKSCWELDALNPKVIDDLITQTVLKYRDQEAWDKDVAQETEHRDLLAGASKEWDRVADFVAAPGSFLEIQNIPEVLTGDVKSLKKQMAEGIASDGSNMDRIITLFDDGHAIEIPAGEFVRCLKPQRKKKTTSIKSKKPKS